MAVIRRRASPASPGLREGLIASAADFRRIAIEKGIRGEPFDIKRAAVSLFPIRLFHEPMEGDLSGYLEQRVGFWALGINSFQHPRRQRFTVAHELGHFVLHSQSQSKFVDKVFLRDNSNRNAMEKEADRFAAELLMPKERFLHHVNSGVTDLKSLSDIFDVSELAIRYRASDLGLMRR